MCSVPDYFPPPALLFKSALKWSYLVPVHGNSHQCKSRNMEGAVLSETTDMAHDPTKHPLSSQETSLRDENK